MSIAHLGLAGDDRQSGESRGGSRGDRVPPHDLLAEQSAIGGMLLSKDAVADVIETVRGVDFYVPKHETIFNAVLTLYSHGEPTDVIAVTDELTKTGELSARGWSRVPPHADRPRSDRGERWLLRDHRHREGCTASPRRGGHSHRSDGLRQRGRSPRPRQQRPGRDLLGHLRRAKPKTTFH